MICWVLTGCFFRGGGGDLDLTPTLSDPWEVSGFRGRYLEGTEFPVELNNADPDRTYEVTSTDESVITLTQTATGIDAAAVGVGDAIIILFEDGVEVNRYDIHVAQADSLTLTLENEGLRGYTVDLEGAVTIHQGGSADVHVRYFEGEERLYGFFAASVEGDIPAEVAPASTRGNAFRLSPTASGDFAMVFGAGELREEVTVRVRESVTSLAFSGDRNLLLFGSTDTDDSAETIRTLALDEEGNRFQGSLPIQWTLDGRSLGEATFVSVLGGERVLTLVAELDGMRIETTTFDGDVLLAR